MQRAVSDASLNAGDRDGTAGSSATWRTEPTAGRADTER